MINILDIKNSVLNHPNIEYCNVLTDTVYNIIHPNLPMNKHILIEDYEDENIETPYHTYVINRIYEELDKYGVTFISLMNSSGEDKTFAHLFVLFKTMDGIIRFESYGQSELYEIENDRVVVKPGYVLYCGRLITWSNFEQDIEQLLIIDPGIQRLDYWNNIFSSNEMVDTSFPIDIVIFNPE
jgi:hypothetical protein